MYVGMTRARKRLYLLHAFQRTQWGSSEQHDPSRFLADIPAELTLASSRVGRLGGAYRQSTSWGGPPKISATKLAPPADAQFKAGQKVFHDKFGSGTVIGSRMSGGDEEVSVAFEKAGLKRLLASYANLKVVK